MRDKIGTCKHCASWRTDELVSGFGVWGFCEKARHSNIGTDKTLSTAIAVNMERLEEKDSQLMTGMNYGCVHFEAKD